MTEYTTPVSKRVVKSNLRSPFFVELMIIIFLVEFLKGSLLVTLLPIYMKNSLGLTAWSVGVAFSLQYVGDNLFRSPFGWIAERLGYRKTMSGALLMTVIAVVIIAFTTAPIWIAIACLILGIGTSPLWPCAMTGATEISGPNNSNGTAIGALETASLLGIGAGPILMNFLMQRTSSNYHTSFLVLIGCGIVLVLVALLLPGKVESAKSRMVVDKVIHKNPVILFTSRVKQLILSVKKTMYEVKHSLKVSWLVYPALFMQSFVIGLFTPVITLYVQNELGFSPNMFSLLLIAGGGITVVALIPCGKLIDRFGTAPFLHFGFLLAAVSIFLFSMVHSILLVFTMVALIGISYAFILPGWNTYVSHLVPKGERGAIWGFFLTLQGSGMVVGPLVSGRIWDVMGHEAPFIVSSLVMATLFIVHLLLTRKPRNRAMVE
jgi:DHA1 family multidrug resistance protein-like MFS transporter